LKCFKSAVLLFVLAAFITAVSCHGDRSPPFYLKKCFQDESGEVILKIHVPTNYDGFLTVEGHPGLTQVITEPGLYNLGVLSPGEYTFCLELIHNDVARSRFWIELAGTTECCTLVVTGPPNPPGPELTDEWYLCPIGGEESPPKYLLRLDGFVTGDPDDSVTFDGYDVLVQLFDDGTGVIFGTVNIVEGGEGEFNLETFLESTVGPDPSLRYFDITTGTLVNVNDPYDVTNLVGHGPPLQIGNGGNGKNDNFGLSGWVNFQRGNIGSLETHWQASDFLGDLNEDPCLIPPLVNIHIDGCSIVFEGVDPNCPLTLKFGLSWEAITEDTVITFFDLPKGNYDVKVLDCYNNLLFEDDVSVGFSDCEDCKVDPPYPVHPKWKKCKILVCIKGRKSKFLPWEAAVNLVKKGKAKLGPCRCGRPVHPKVGKDDDD